MFVIILKIFFVKSSVIKACDSSQDPTTKNENIQNNEERLFNWYKELIVIYLKGDLKKLDEVLDQEEYV